MQDHHIERRSANKRVQLNAEKPHSLPRRREGSWDHPYADMTKGIEVIMPIQRARGFVRNAQSMEITNR
jgi:hypothetical protein